MADKPTVHIGENSPEEVAYKLMKYIFDAEGKGLGHGSTKPTRAEVLTTYAACISTVRTGVAPM